MYLERISAKVAPTSTHTSSMRVHDRVHYARGKSKLTSSFHLTFLSLSNWPLMLFSYERAQLDLMALFLVCRVPRRAHEVCWKLIPLRFVHEFY